MWGGGRVGKKPSARSKTTVIGKTTVRSKRVFPLKVRRGVPFTVSHSANYFCFILYGCVWHIKLFGDAGHHGPVGLCTRIIPGGRGFDSRHCHSFGRDNWKMNNNGKMIGKWRAPSPFNNNGETIEKLNNNGEKKEWKRDSNLKTSSGAI